MGNPHKHGDSNPQVDHGVRLDARLAPRGGLEGRVLDLERGVGREVGDHRELPVEDGFVAVDVEPHDAPDARDAGTIDGKPDVGCLVLPIRREIQRARLAPDVAAIGRRRERADRSSGLRIDQVGSGIRLKGRSCK